MIGSLPRAFSCFCLVVLCNGALAGPEKIGWPEGYSSSFVRYHTVDKPAGRSPPRVRFFYVNPDALRNATRGAPAPVGTILIMEDHLAVLDKDEKPVLDSNGRFIPSATITNVFVQQKEDGWGAQYPESKRNGDWEYAWFKADGSRKTDAKFDGCFSCHKDRASNTDYNFTFAPFVNKIKP